MSESKPCCSGPVVIDGIYKPLSRSLLDYGKEVYSETTSTQRVILWVFSFYDAKSECPVCRNGIERMYDWFHKFGLLTDPVRGVRMVLDDDPDSNPVFTDLKLASKPVNIFTDENGMVYDIIYEFPDDAWLDKYILPLIQRDTRFL